MWVLRDEIILYLVAIPLIWCATLSLTHVRKYPARLPIISELLFWTGVGFIITLSALSLTSNLLLSRIGNAYHVVVVLAFIPVWFMYRKDIIKAITSMGFIISIHEGLWIVTYFLTWHFTVYILAYYFLFSLLLVSILVFSLRAGLLTWLPRPKLLRFLASMLIYYMLWALIGFPITVTPEGGTIWVHNLDVNLIEVLSWIGPIIMYLL
jgi:hypothetical protein